MELANLGWKKEYDQYKEQIDDSEIELGRVSSENRSQYRVFTADGEITAYIMGKMHYESESAVDLPIVGDWVTFKILDGTPPSGVIQSILPRHSLFARKDPSSHNKIQPIASNIDIVFITVGMDQNFNLPRIERYLTLAWESNAKPVVVLTKADLSDDFETKLKSVRDIAFNVDVIAISVVDETGMEELRKYLTPGTTIALLGSSGVGKSTLTNYLLGEEKQKVLEVRKDDSKGRHTTTNRQMIILPSGALVIDTPGMRELQLTDADEGFTTVFQDIENLASDCRYTDCRHETEPGCAVIQALKTGLLDKKHVENYQKLAKEIDYHNRKQNQTAALIEKSKWKSIHKIQREFKKG
ncbi:MAG: ribosome small subunit-dependent GTPase A [Armatimonadota bacterium]